MKKTLIKAMVAGTLFASLLSFAGCAKGQSIEKAKKSVERDNEVAKEKQRVEDEKRAIEVAKMFDSMGIKMVSIPESNFKMLNTEVTQKLYESVMGENPSYFQTGSEVYKEEYEEEYIITEGEKEARLHVENVSWYDAIYFCNKLSIKFGFTPVYAVDGKTDVATWNYTPHKGESIRGEVTQNTKANGFRLPTEEEWEYAAKGGQNYTYSGSDDLDEVGWYKENSGGRTHPVAQKKANGYGLHDMSGNVREWCWDVSPLGSDYRHYRGGSYNPYGDYCGVGDRSISGADDQSSCLGFRIVCFASN